MAFSRNMIDKTDEVAVSGTFGGNLLGALADIVVNEIADRVECARVELRRACESAGVPHYRNLKDDLHGALDDLCDGIYDDTTEQFFDFGRAVPLPQAELRAAYTQIFTDVAARALSQGRAELDHFAAQLSTKGGLSRKELIERIALAAISALLGGVTTLEFERLANGSTNEPPLEKTNYASTPSPHLSK